MSDVTQAERNVLAMCLDDWGHPTEADNVRNGEDLESYEIEFRLIHKLQAFGMLSIPEHLQ